MKYKEKRNVDVKECYDRKFNDPCGYIELRSGIIKCEVCGSHKAKLCVLIKRYNHRSKIQYRFENMTKCVCLRCFKIYYKTIK